ncbi:hypothetical protein [Nitrosospira briensis]|uniref:hypothetical protein n=1 Tax=Nitrosospira briensis TaxID=35799 RepID=UPI0018D183BF|nr:hypothetical protein [Nitrosospira briensis]
MVRKISKTKSRVHTVKTPVSLVLQTVEIKKCSIERRLPRFAAPRGKIESELNLNVYFAEGNRGAKGVIGLLSLVLNGKSVVGDEAAPFSISFEMEGFYRLDDADTELSESDLTEPLIARIANELYPLAMMRSSELLSMIGYGGVRLSYGLEMEKAMQPS